MRYFFARLDEKHKLLGNFEKILEIFDENSIEMKLNQFWRKAVAKNRAFENNIIFIQQFFPVRGGGSNPPNPPPAYATDLISDIDALFPDLDFHGKSLT